MELIERLEEALRTAQTLNASQQHAAAAMCLEDAVQTALRSSRYGDYLTALRRCMDEIDRQKRRQALLDIYLHER